MIWAYKVIIIILKYKTTSTENDADKHVIQSQMAITTYLKSKQLLPFGFAEPK